MKIWCYTDKAGPIAPRLSGDPGDLAAFISTYARFAGVAAKSHALEMRILCINCSLESFLCLNHSRSVRFCRRNARFGFQPAAY